MSPPKSKRGQSASSKSSDASTDSSSSASSTGEISERRLAKRKKPTKKGKAAPSATNKNASSKRPHQPHGKSRQNGHRAGEEIASYDSDGSMLDLRENLRPIAAYMRDRERMLDEMFRCIRGAKLYAMLPDILKVIRVCSVCLIFALSMFSLSLDAECLFVCLFIYNVLFRIFCFITN